MNKKIRIPKDWEYLKINEFSGSWGSGIGYLNGLNEKGKLISIPCENTTTVRNLEEAFGNVISQNHSVNGSGLKGKEIFYRFDDMGLVLAAFIPVEEYEKLPNHDEEDYTTKTLGEFLSSKDPIIKRNAISILKKLQNIA